MRSAVSLRDLYEAYSDRVQFLVIYIREAHPVDGWDLGSENRIHDPTTIEERRQVAGQCQEALQYGIKTHVDEMDDRVMTAYAAWPERLYLIGKDGRVLYPGARGPWGFKPDELGDAMAEMLAV